MASIRSAYKEAIKCGGEVVLGDRPLEVRIIFYFVCCPFFVWYKVQGIVK